MTHPAQAFLKFYWKSWNAESISGQMLRLPRFTLPTAQGEARLETTANPDIYPEVMERGAM